MRNKKLAAGILAVMLVGVGCGLVGARIEAQTAERPQADAPQIVNAKVEARTAGASLRTTLEELAANTAATTWIGYSVNALAGQGSVCCEQNRGAEGCGTCRLEDGNNGISTTRSDKNGKTVALEETRKLTVLLRVAEHKVMKIRLASDECTIDAGGTRVVWLSGVSGSDSVHYLAQFVRTNDFRGEDDEHVGKQALTAIALHGDAAADQAMAGFVAAAQPVELRKQAVFWLGEARGQAGLTELQKLAKSDASEEVRAQIAFALSVSREPGAVDEMVRIAHEDTSSHVRGQALFWLAQKAGKKASAAITGAIENDPDTDVKKKAVFALSQMPKDEGVPKLIEVAQTNRNPEVRKQAMFWLGQSNDPRALAFFEKILQE
jgi:HEAT repeat protein